MAEQDAASTLPNSKSGSPKLLPKAETSETVDAITRVNTNEREKTETSPAENKVDESQLLTGRRLALAHTGFLR